jgi:hypothetical protein
MKREGEKKKKEKEADKPPRLPRVVKGRKTKNEIHTLGRAQRCTAWFSAQQKRES